MLQSVSRVQRFGRNPTCGDWMLEANQLLSQTPEGNWSPHGDSVMFESFYPGPMSGFHTTKVSPFLARR